MRQVEIVDMVCKNKLLPQLELDIIKEKLTQGVNGIEWLVLSTVTKESVNKFTEDWIEPFIENGVDTLHQVIIDTFLLSSNDFYEKYANNLLISLRHSIDYLQRLKENDYDTYFRLLMEYEAASQLRKGGRTNDDYRA